MKKNTIEIVVIFLVIGVSFLQSPYMSGTESDEPLFTINARARYGGIFPDYLNLWKQQLARIGINVELDIFNWWYWGFQFPPWFGTDVLLVGLSGGGNDPDFTGLYDENGSLNMFGYHTSMDWDEELGTGKNEWYMDHGLEIMPPDSNERIQHYWDWEQYLMDQLCPLIPTFTPKYFIATWSNLNGYNYVDGIIQSWGKMWWDGSHTGQISTDELVIADAAWSDLNPLFQEDSSSKFITSTIMDPLIWYDTDLSVWPHLAESYSYIDDTTIEIVCRDGIKWQTDPDGLFPNEYFDAEDVYFTIQAWKTVSNEPYTWDWVESIDIIDDMTLRINVDADPTTPGQQAYAPSLSILSTSILPEHYLNQTQFADGVTPDISHPAWNTFATNAFGTGLFEISDFTEGVETILSVNPNSWWLDEIVTSDSELNWEERFGFGATYDSNGLTQLRVRIIPNYLTALHEFEAGTLDLGHISSTPYKREKFLAESKFNVHSKLSSSMGFFAFNMRETQPIIGSREPCPNDPSLTIGLAVRKAISYATNRDEINQVVHGGDHFITDWPIYPSMGIWCNPNIIRYNFDLDMAKYYLYLAGFNVTNPFSNRFDSLIAHFQLFWPVYLSIFVGIPSLILGTFGSVKLFKHFKKTRANAALQKDIRSLKYRYKDKL